ncbi:MAG: citrate (Si)-synthase [Dehalococcoidia bacterium]|nr:citrate (Si)-synthase [Dehalococcoidia bacterium]
MPRRLRGQPVTTTDEPQPTSAAPEVAIHRGLNGVYFDRSGVSFIDGREGTLLYRGYSIHDLAERSTFEETAYLLLYGALPTRTQLAEFDAELRASRAIPEGVTAVIDAVRHAHPMEVLRTAISALGAFDPEVADNSAEATRRKGVRLTAQVATIVGTHQALRQGRAPTPPNPALSHAANFLAMVLGAPPSERAARLMDKDLILHAEHGSNASAFTARVVAGTDANLHAALTAAVGALSGPAHGGAAENVMRMAQEIEEPERAAEYVKRLRANREPVMGFGHRVYRAEDPRARHLREDVKALSLEMEEPKWYAILEAVVEAMRPYARLGVNVNVDFYAGVIYYLLGIPEDLFVPIFAVGRVPGWTVQVIEQQEHNILIRPLTAYNGPPPRPYLPLDARA